MPDDELVPPNSRPGLPKRTAIPKAEFLAFMSDRRPDPTLAADIDWISEGDTDGLGPLA